MPFLHTMKTIIFGKMFHGIINWIQALSPSVRYVLFPYVLLDNVVYSYYICDMKEIKAPIYRYEFEVGYWMYHLWPKFIWNRVGWMYKFVRVYLVYKDIVPHKIVNGVMKYYSRPKTSTLFRVDIGKAWFYSTKKDISFIEYMVKNLQWVEVKPNIVRLGFVCVDTVNCVIWHDAGFKPKKTRMSGYINEWLDYFGKI